MVELTQSFAHWLFEYDKELLPLVMFGHLEVITEEMLDQYLVWCQTDDGKQYLEGGSKYKEDW